MRDRRSDGENWIDR